jgi:hypothetical protein
VQPDHRKEALFADVALEQLEDTLTNANEYEKIKIDGSQSDILP